MYQKEFGGGRGHLRSIESAPPVPQLGSRIGNAASVASGNGAAGPGTADSMAGVGAVSRKDQAKEVPQSVGAGGHHHHHPFGVPS